MQQRVKQGLVNAYKFPLYINAFLWMWILLVMAIVLSNTFLWPKTVVSQFVFVILTSIGCMSVIGFLIGLITNKPVSQ